MPRYFFHAQWYPDDHGTELPDLDSAQAAALATMCQILPDMAPDLWKHGAFHLTVSDDQGETLLALETRVTSANDATTTPLE